MFIDHIIRRVDRYNDLINGHYPKKINKTAWDYNGWHVCAKRSGGYCGNAGEPSDGHPQEELTPDFAFYRPMSYNALIRMIYYPDMEV